jgi:putative restriction endonuclease
MNSITKIIDAYKKTEIDNLFSLYKYLTTKFWKEDVDLEMYDEFSYECTTELSDKRTIQNKFRKSLIIRYEKCIISGNGEIVCEACHIKPYILCNEKEKSDVNNGLLLDSSLHKLFDNYLISINPNTFALEISNKLDMNNYNFAWKYKNKLIKVNNISRKYLEFHYNLFNK